MFLQPAPTDSVKAPLEGFLHCLNDDICLLDRSRLLEAPHGSAGVPATPPF